MKDNTIFKSLLESKRQEANGHEKLTYKLVKQELDYLFKTNKIAPEDFSIDQIYHEIVEAENPHLDRNSSSHEIAEAISTTAFPTITGSIIHGTVMPEYVMEQGDLHTLVTEEQASKTGDNQVVGLLDMDGLEGRLEGMAYDETDIGEKKYTCKTRDFGRIVSLTRETIFDDRTGEVLKRARNIGKKGGQHRAKYISDTIVMAARSALGESAGTGFIYDGTIITQAQFYANTHATVIDKQVNDNISEVGLTQAGLDAILLNYQKLVDTKGDEIMVRPKTLLVPTALEFTAKKLLGSATDPETVSNDINPVKGAYNLVINPFQSSATEFYLGDFTSQLLWLWVWKPETAFLGDSSDISFRNQVISQFRFNYYGGVCHTDYRYIHRGG